MGPILIYPNDVLRLVSNPVDIPLSREDKELLDEMYTYVKEHKDDAVGLSAIQVGIPKRMCAIRSCADGKSFNYKLVNPRIVKRSPRTYVHHEGCLSVEGDGSDSVVRHESVTVTGYDAISNKQVVINASGFEAAILQHEIDHMDGKLYIDRIR